jgi:uncharacterized repeat protein (TIGR03943 family)
VDRLTQSVLVALVGGALVGLTASGRFALYVKTGFGPLLLAAGVALLLVGLLSAVLAVRADREPDSRIGAVSGPGPRPDRDRAVGGDSRAEPGHSRDRSRAAWLLVIPVLALLLAPPALGADAVARTSGSQALAGAPPPAPADQVVTGDGGYKPNDGLGKAATETTKDGQDVYTMDFPPLPAGANPAVPLKEFVQRALYDPTGSVSKHPVTVIGFIAPAGENFTDGYSIAQLIISCCAADARAIRVHVDGPPPFPENTWVRAVITAYPGSGTLANEYVPTASVASIVKTPQPDDPYGR